MIKFNSQEEIKETYDTGKYDIFWENGKTKYEVRHIGSTLYCHNVDKGYGMGAIHNFSTEGFYGIEKPEPIPEPTNEEDTNEEGQTDSQD